jgi:protein-S-isoprenylcysteine O-methyltransferase Ste14
MSLGELFSELARETSTLVHDEVQLAKAELTQKVSHIGKNMTGLAIGGALAYAGLLALVAAAIAGITAAGLPVWASALIVGVVLAGIGGVLVMTGLAAMKRVDPVPHQTVQTLKEDGEWAKQQVK